MSKRIAVAVNGACGRMGQRVVHLLREDAEFHVVAAIEAAAHPRQGVDMGKVLGEKPMGVTVSSELAVEVHPDVLIDFSIPEASVVMTETCAGRGIPIIIATTGHTAAQRDAIRAAAHQTAVLHAANLSLTVNLLMRLLAFASSALKGRDFDVEIIERHHRHKKDSPSGTAITLAHIIQKHMGQETIRHGREGLLGERPRSEIGIHAVRIGDNVGEHEVIFSTMGESLELIHKSTSRDSYARGAVQAAKYLANRPAGWYHMTDVLGI